MIYAKLEDASALQRLDVALSEATKPKWYQRLLIIKLSATEGMSVPQLAKMFNLSELVGLTDSLFHDSNL